MLVSLDMPSAHVYVYSVQLKINDNNYTKKIISVRVGFLWTHIE